MMSVGSVEKREGATTGWERSVRRRLSIRVNIFELAETEISLLVTLASWHCYMPAIWLCSVCHGIFYRFPAFAGAKVAYS